jgi:hypothetical protein
VATGTLTETAIEEVAENLEEIADVARMIDARAVRYFIGGVTVGAVLGFYWGYKFNREKIKAEAFKESEVELAKMRDFYQQKVAAYPASKPKPTAEEVVEERGYSVPPVVEEEVRPLRPPVPISGQPFSPSREPKRTADGEKDKNEGWSYPHELSKRSPNRPYIIHQDEFFGKESGYQQVTYSYYVGDAIITDEDDTVISNPDNLIGMENLNHWGHGADDFNVLYIRNVPLEIEFEICRTNKSYEEEVLGLENNDEST